MPKTAEAGDNDNSSDGSSDRVIENVRMIVSALEYLKKETSKTDVREIDMAVDSALKICTATYSSLLDGNYVRPSKVRH